MAKTKAKEVETTEEVKNNIEGLELLKKEYLKDLMPPRKVVALKNKLVSLYLEIDEETKKPKITEDEQELMELLFAHDREAGTLSGAHAEIINRIEYNRCEDECVVTIENAPQVLYLEKDLVCKFRKDHLKKRYHVYVPRQIQSDFQYSLDLARKLDRKIPVAEDEYPKAKTLIHYINLNQKEFKAWFVEVENELQAIDTEAEEVYTF